MRSSPVLPRLSLGPAAAAPASKEKVDPDAAPLQGSWNWDPAAKRSDAQPPVLLQRVVVKGDTITFHYNTTPVTVEGLQNMALGAGALTRASDGSPVFPFTSVFRYDVTLLQVASTTPPIANGIFTPVNRTTAMLESSRPAARTPKKEAE